MQMEYILSKAYLLHTTTTILLQYSKTLVQWNGSVHKQKFVSIVVYFLRYKILNAPLNYIC